MVEYVAFPLCSGEFHDLDQKSLISSGEVISEQASPSQTSVVSFEVQNILEVPFKDPVECVASTLCECEFHDFDPKLTFSSGEVSPEQASPYQTSVASLESHKIIEAPFKGLC